MIETTPFLWVERLFDALGAELPGAAHRDVHPSDEMLLHGLERAEGDLDRAVLEYWSSGYQVAQTLRQIAVWRFGSWAAVPSMLDFGSGYGRVTRHLLELASQRITVAEILQGALEFQAQTFGVQTTTSASRPEECRLHRHALVYAGSLFTHLPRETFSGWLRVLLAAVEEGGVLVFSAHDLDLMPAKHHEAGLEQQGFAFHASSESSSLDHAEYGSTWVSESFVADLLIELAPGMRGRRIPRGLCNYQDLWIVARGASDPAELALDGGPQGAIELCRLEGSELQLAGWAIDRSPGFEACAVEVRIEGQLVGGCESLYPRPDLLGSLGELGLPGHGESPESYLHSGWEISLPFARPMRRGDTLLTVVARSTGGSSVPLFAGSVESALFLTARENHHRKVDEVAHLEVEVAELRERIRAMRQSRFWKIRDRWFAAKRALGLTEQP